MSANANAAVLGRAAKRETADSAWQSLYLVGGIAALVAALLFRRNIAAEISLFSGQVPPDSVTGWFSLFHNDRLLGLAFYNLFDLVNYALLGLMFLGLYAALRGAQPGYMGLALSFGLVGMGVYFASNQAFAMLSLSEQYAAATTEAQRTSLLAAGETLLAINNPNAAYQGLGVHLSLLSVTLAGLISAWVMLRSTIFSKATAYLGMVAHLFVLGHFIMLIFAPDLIFIPHVAAAVPLVIWELLIARRLLQLRRVNKAAP